jgi:hypothetical protein
MSLGAAMVSSAPGWKFVGFAARLIIYYGRVAVRRTNAVTVKNARIAPTETATTSAQCG